MMACVTTASRFSRLLYAGRTRLFAAIFLSLKHYKYISLARCLVVRQHGIDVQLNRQQKPSPGHRVLVIDDDIDTAQSLFFLLLDMGHDAAYATDGNMALDMARKLQPEFVLLDIGLPDLDGGEVATRLRRTPGCESTVIIALTGLGDEHRRRMLQAGCDAFYIKPLEVNLIEGLLKR
jgi:CheY-like chemotaxis protein